MARDALVGLALAVCLQASACCQNAARRTQMGVKTSDSGFATALEIEVPIDDAEAGEKALLESFDLLLEATTEAGFTPVGTGRITMRISFEVRPEGRVPFLLQVPIVEQLTEEDWEADESFDIVRIEPEKVAYTYHKGPYEEMEITIMRLGQWTIANEHELSGYPTIIVYSTTPETEVAEVHIPVK